MDPGLLLLTKGKIWSELPVTSLIKWAIRILVWVLGELKRML
jgi:hypothetical protein